MTVLPHLSVGFGIADITPDRPLQLAGIENTRRGREALDALKVRALCVTKGAEHLVLVAIDTLYVSRRLCERLEGWLEREHGIPGKNLFVTATHTHCAPLLLKSYREGEGLDEAYVNYVDEQVRSAIEAALNSTEEATVSYGSGSASVSINRRSKRVDRDGLRRMRPSNVMRNRPNPRGSVDNLVRCVRFETRSVNALDTLLVNVGCHPSIIRNDVYSADFPGFIQEQLRSRTGREQNVIFLQGFSGDTRARLLEFVNFAVWPPGRFIDWLFDRQRFRKNSLRDDAAWVAREIVQAILTMNMTGLSTPKLSAEWTQVPLALSPGSAGTEVVNAAVAEASRPRGDDVSLRMRVWSLSDDLQLVGLEGEIFSDYANWMATALQSQTGLIMPVSCVGGMIGYIPTEAALMQGGYEVDRSRPLFGLTDRFAPSLERTLKDSIRELVGN